MTAMPNASLLDNASLLTMDASPTDLFAYDRWANGRWLGHLQSIDAPPADATATLAHLIATGTVWLLRVQGEPAGAVPLWPDWSLEACAPRLNATNAAWSAFLDAASEADLEAEATYRNSSGTQYRTPVRDILLHLITHGHYHRGQIAQTVRHHGHEPAWTDYIAYVRRRD